jgi:hypothetical protein
MKCPGQDTQYWKPGAIFDAKCPECGSSVEFFKDDTTRKCAQCGHRFINPKMDFGCASYCQFAEQCVGNLPPELLAGKEDLLKDRVAIEMKKYFKTDFKRIGYATRVARYAERIGKAEGGNLAVILCAAYLNDIGEPKTEKQSDGTSSEPYHRQSVPIARSILEKLGAPEELIRVVCDIIARKHTPGPDETSGFLAVHDANRIAALEDEQKENPMVHDQLTAVIDDSLLTVSGRKEAINVLLS